MPVWLMPVCRLVMPARGPAFNAAGVGDVGDPPGDVDADLKRVVGVLEAGSGRRRRPGAAVELEARHVAVAVVADAPVWPALTGSDVFQQVLKVTCGATVPEVAIGETAVLWRAAAPGIEEGWRVDDDGARRSCCCYTSKCGS